MALCPTRNFSRYFDLYRVRRANLPYLDHPARIQWTGYDRHGYTQEDRRIMNAVARHVLLLVEGTGTSNVAGLRWRPGPAAFCPGQQSSAVLGTATSRCSAH